MSIISLFPHKHIVTFLGEPIYLPKKDFIYNQYGKVSTEQLIWRNDLKWVPAIISIRACIQAALESLILKNDQPVEIVEELCSMDSPDEPWRDESDYYVGYHFYNKYILETDEDPSDFKQFTFEALGLFLIGFYPSLMTEEENQLFNKLNIVYLPNIPSFLELPVKVK